MGLCALTVHWDTIDQASYATFENLRQPWIRRGPNCPDGVTIVEGPIQPIGLLQEVRRNLPIKVFATVEPPWENRCLTPEDGILTISERTEHDEPR